MDSSSSTFTICFRKFSIFGLVCLKSTKCGVKKHFYMFFIVDTLFLVVIPVRLRKVYLDNSIEERDRVNYYMSIIRIIISKGVVYKTNLKIYHPILIYHYKVEACLIGRNRVAFRRRDQYLNIFTVFRI